MMIPFCCKDKAYQSPKTHVSSFAARCLLVEVVMLLLMIITSMACDDEQHHHTEDDESSFVSNHRSTLADSTSEGHHHMDCGTQPMTDSERFDMGNSFAVWKKAKEQRKLEGRDLQSDSTNYVIPVYFHVIQSDDLTGNLTDYHRDMLMSELNNCYRGSAFTFELKEVNNYINSDWFNCSFDNQLEFKEATRVEGTGELFNIWLCNLTINVGWSYYPPILNEVGVLDGVVIPNPSLGGISMLDIDNATLWDYEVYASLCHEAGHWLGLAHTFEGGCNVTSHYSGFPLFNDTENYYFVGDGVEDTPAHIQPPDSVEMTSFCYLDQTLDTCEDTDDLVDPGVDPMNNYMNYNFGFCQIEYGSFTAGQAERMLAQFETYRLNSTPWTADYNSTEPTIGPSQTGSNPVLTLFSPTSEPYTVDTAPPSLELSPQPTDSSSVSSDGPSPGPAVEEVSSSIRLDSILVAMAVSLSTIVCLTT